MKKKLIVTIITIVILGIIIGIGVNLFIGKDIKNNYDYNLKYEENANTYDIYKKNKEVIVYSEEQVECIKAPCPPITNKYKIKFSNINMQKINDFINNIFNNSNNSLLQIYKETISNEQYNILKSIIHNDENLLNNN